MCCENASHRTRCCLCTVLIIHVIIAVSLATALVLRYVVYKDIDFYDMPTDQRVLHRSVSSIFCHSHRVQSFLPKNGDQKETDKKFDAYSSSMYPNSNPNLTIITKDQQLDSLTTLKVGGSRSYDFNFMKDTKVDLSLCEEGADAAGSAFWYCLTQGVGNQKKVLDKTKKGHPLKKSDLHLCLSTDDSPLPQCSKNAFTNVSRQANATDDFTFIYLYPDAPNATGLMHFRANYHLKRKKYDLDHGGKLVPHGKSTTDVNIPPQDYIIVDFRYHINEPNTSLSKITLRYRCDPNVTVYMAFFFWLPLLVIIVVGVVALYRQSRTGEYNLLSSTRSYGSLQT